MADNTQTKEIRLQKFLAERGIASRRASAEIIKQGHVSVNGKRVVEAGLHINPEKDMITIDGKKLSADVEKRRTIILYKPRGYICSTKSIEGPTVYELIKGISERIVPVGRLDRESEGLLLMSNDGDFILKLTHPRYEHEKVYEVSVLGAVDDLVLKKLQSSMIIDGYKIRPVKVVVLKKEKDSTLLEFTLKEGRNRQIRKMCEQAGLKITKLLRTRIEDITLSGLKPGEWRDYKG